MKNCEMMDITLSRGNVLRLSMAITSLIHEMKRELACEETSGDRKVILTGSIRMWEGIRADIKKQFTEKEK